MARWLPLREDIFRSPVFAALSLNGKVLYIAFRGAHAIVGEGGRVPAQYGTATGLGLVVPAAVVGADVQAGIDELVKVDLIRPEQDSVVLVDFAPDVELPKCTRCKRRNPCPRQSRCPKCTAEDSAEPAQTGRRDSAETPQKERSDAVCAKSATPTGPHPTEPSTPTAPQPVQTKPPSESGRGVQAPSRVPGPAACAAEEQGGIASDDREEPGERGRTSLFDVLVMETRIRSKSPNRRLALSKMAGTLRDQGATVADLRDLIERAKRESTGDPSALLADWISTGAWRGKLPNANGHAGSDNLIASLVRRMTP